MESYKICFVFFKLPATSTNSRPRIYLALILAAPVFFFFLLHVWHIICTQYLLQLIYGKQMALITCRRKHAHLVQQVWATRTVLFVSNLICSHFAQSKYELLPQTASTKVTINVFSQQVAGLNRPNTETPYNHKSSWNANVQKGCW